MTGLVVREARREDSARLAGLIAQIEFDVDQPGVEERIAALAAAGEPVLVAERDGEILGLLDWHVMSTIHRPAPVGRIATMVVTEQWRGKGIGTALVAAAEQRMIARGCECLEVTSNLKLSRAHAFYERCGLQRSSFRFFKKL